MAASRGSIALASLLLGSTAACESGDSSAPGGASAANSVVFTLPDIEGRNVDVGAEGELIVLAFWATWCQPCQSELSKLGEVHRDMHGRGLRIYAINVDGPDTAINVGPWVTREGYPFPVLIDSDTELLGRYHPRREIPYTVVLTPDGSIVEEHQSYQPGDVDAMAKRLDERLPRLD